MKNSILKAIVSCVMVIGIFYLFKNVIFKNVDLSGDEFNNMRKDFYESSYPKTPKTLIERNNRIMKYLYGVNPKDSEVEVLVNELRKLYHEDFLNINPIKDHLNAVKKELRQFEKDDIFIEDIIVVKDEVNIYDESIRLISVKNMFNKKENDYIVTYVVRLDNEKNWKIQGFK